MQGNPSTEVSPWSIILYSDEVSPGNQLKADNRRSSGFDIAVRWFTFWFAGLCATYMPDHRITVYCCFIKSATLTSKVSSMPITGASRS